MLRHRIFSKIFVWIMLTSLIVGMIFVFITFQDRVRLAEEAIIRENTLLAGVTSNVIVSGHLNAQWPFQTLKLISDSDNIIFLWVVKPSGEVYYADNPAMFGKFVQKPYFLPAAQVVVEDVLSEQDERVKLIIHPLEMELGESPWALYLGASLRSMEIVKRKTISISILAIISIILLTGFISFYFSRRITRPLDQLRKGAEIIGRGNLEYRINIKTGDEIEALGKGFNRMAEHLRISRVTIEESKEALEIKVKARTQELQELAESLEDKVQERTKELQARIEELERFHRLTVGRELKMIELKKELKRLRDKKRSKE